MLELKLRRLKKYESYVASTNEVDPEMEFLDPLNPPRFPKFFKSVKIDIHSDSETLSHLENQTDTLIKRMREGNLGTNTILMKMRHNLRSPISLILLLILLFFISITIIFYFTSFDKQILKIISFTRTLAPIISIIFTILVYIGIYFLSMVRTGGDV